MAFIKNCTGTVEKCLGCGKPGVFTVSGKKYCAGCADKKSSKSSSKKD